MSESVWRISLVRQKKILIKFRNIVLHFIHMTPKMCIFFYRGTPKVIRLTVDRILTFCSNSRVFRIVLRGSSPSDARYHLQSHSLFHRFLLIKNSVKIDNLSCFGPRPIRILFWPHSLYTETTEIERINDTNTKKGR